MKTASIQPESTDSRNKKHVTFNNDPNWDSDVETEMYETETIEKITHEDLREGTPTAQAVVSPEKLGSDTRHVSKNPTTATHTSQGELNKPFYLPTTIYGKSGTRIILVERRI